MKGFWQLTQTQVKPIEFTTIRPIGLKNQEKMNYKN